MRFKTVLFVKDLVSGHERPLYDGLERDMQETWAIHGVYPAMAWTPDSRAIVFWAGGKIRRVERASGQSAVIPFHVKGVAQGGAGRALPREGRAGPLPGEDAALGRRSRRRATRSPTRRSGASGCGICPRARLAA